MQNNCIINQLEDWQHKLLTASTGTIRYTAKNDYMFKAICQTNTYALKGLLAALLHMKAKEILDLEILNPIQLGETVQEKDCILDVKLKLNQNRIINIEMQVVHQADWVERSLVYLCRTVSKQLKPGASYEGLLSTIHIGILDFDLFSDHLEFHSLYHLMDERTGHLYTGKIALDVVNLSQINRATDDDIASGLRDWASLFQATTWEEMMMIAKNDESMQAFTFSLKQLTDDEKIQMQCEAREMYEHDKASFIHQGFKEGVKSGIQQEQSKTLLAQQRADATEQKNIALEEELHRLKAELSK